MANKMVHALYACVPNENLVRCTRWSYKPSALPDVKPTALKAVIYDIPQNNQNITTTTMMMTIKLAMLTTTIISSLHYMKFYVITERQFSQLTVKINRNDTEKQSAIQVRFK